MNTPLKLIVSIGRSISIEEPIKHCNDVFMASVMFMFSIGNVLNTEVQANSSFCCGINGPYHVSKKW